MEKMIMSEFEKHHSKAGDVLMMRNLQHGLFQKLNPRQQDEAMKALNALVEKDFITYEDGSNGPECIRLTELGFDSLYTNSNTASSIAKLIMREFESQNSRAGHILRMGNLNISLFRKLNPKEAVLLDEALNKLIDEGLVTHETGGMECLRLTEKGYDSLY